MSPGDIEEKLKVGAGGALLGAFGSKLVGKLATKGLAGADTLAGKLQGLAPRIAESPGIAALAGGMGAAGLVGKPKTQEEAKAADLGQEAAKAETTGNPEAYMKKINENLAQYWALNGGEQAFPGQFEVFKALVSQVTNNFDPEKVAPILFPDAERRDKYLKA